MTDQPVGWLVAPHGKFRANLAHKLAFPPSTTVWAVPLFLHAQDTRLREAARTALDACQHVVHSCDPGPDPADVQAFADADGALMALREALGESDE